MQIELKESLLIYSECFAEGHPLRDIALTTLHELSCENPFRRDLLLVNRIDVASLKARTAYSSLGDACSSLDIPFWVVKNEIQEVLKKYRLKIV